MCYIYLLDVLITNKPFDVFVICGFSTNDAPRAVKGWWAEPQREEDGFNITVRFGSSPPSSVLARTVQAPRCDRRVDLKSHFDIKNRTKNDQPPAGNYLRTNQLCGGWISRPELTKLPELRMDQARTENRPAKAQTSKTPFILLEINKNVSNAQLQRRFRSSQLRQLDVSCQINRIIKNPAAIIVVNSVFTNHG